MRCLTPWLAGSARRMPDEHVLQLMQLAVPITATPSALNRRAFGVRAGVNYTNFE